MAGNVPKRVLRQPEVDKCLIAGTRLWKFEEVMKCRIIDCLCLLACMCVCV